MNSVEQRRRLGKGIWKNWDLYLLILPVIVYFLIFQYGPMYGVQIAFKNFSPVLGIWDSPWVGLQHLERFFAGFYFERLIFNTIAISVYQLLVGFPIPIILALLLHEVGRRTFKRGVQLVTYAPHFISTVAMVGMIYIFLSPGGVVNRVVEFVTGSEIRFLTESGWFKSIYVWSGVWQHMGWGSIIYIAALAGVDPQLHEAAKVDGASIWKRILHINLPALMPTITILFILNAGQIMSVGFEKVFLLQNNLNLSGSDVIATYVYRTGIQGAQFSFAAAVNLFNSVINFVLLVLVNIIARRAGGNSLW